MRAVIGWKSVLYQSTKHWTEQKLSCRLQICAMSNHFPDFFLAFYLLLEVKFRNKRAGK